MLDREALRLRKLRGLQARDSRIRTTPRFDVCDGQLLEERDAFCVVAREPHRIVGELDRATKSKRATRVARGTPRPFEGSRSVVTRSIVPCERLGFVHVRLGE